MFGGIGLRKQTGRITFVSQAAKERGVAEKLGLRSRVEAVRGMRALSKHCMVRNSFLPKVEVNPETFAVTVDGVHATVPAAKCIPLSQRYFFS